MAKSCNPGPGAKMGDEQYTARMKGKKTAAPKTAKMNVKTSQKPIATKKPR